MAVFLGFMGKFFNAGQTCIAPDYLFIPSGWENRVEEQLKTFVQQHYPRLIDNENYTSIINESHTLRLLDLVEDARSKGARVVEFGSPSEDKRKLPMYLLFDVHPSMRVMSEEIFGPILPVLTYSAITEVIDAINKAPNPLAIYYFGHDKKEMQQIQKRTLSGALTFNDTLMQVAVDDLPFGGVGNSGMGHYHGQEGFDTCSKLKAIMVHKRMSPISWLYPPYGALMRLFLSLVGGIKLK